MTTIFALAALGSWSYAGFLDEPAGRNPTPSVNPAPAPAPAPPPPPAPVPPPRPEAPEPPRTTPSGAVEAAKPTAAPAASFPAPSPPAASFPAPSPPAAPAAPIHYRLADASGQAWEHPDPAQLRSFVENRNRSLVAPTYFQAAPARYSSCSGGRCR